jgi:hypothetical protein
MAARQRHGREQVPSRVLPALEQLLEAHDQAQSAGRPVWDFAVAIEQLRAAGLTTHDLRWLVLEGYAEHAEETTARRKKGPRTFRRTGEFSFTGKQCMVLTETGVNLARQVGHSRRSGGDSPEQQDHRRSKRRVPYYHEGRRRLCVGEIILHRYRQPAPYQETLLLECQRRRWKQGIANPLPRVSGIDPLRHLQNTIRNLNRRLKPPLIRFRCDEAGRIYWEWRS